MPFLQSRFLAVFSKRGYVFEVVEMHSKSKNETFYRINRKTIGDEVDSIIVQDHLTFEELILHLAHSAEDGSFIQYELSKNKKPKPKSLDIGIDI